ncbi:MAG TPA: cyclic-di-AMP receptor [Tissierellaceae bacterium]|nr:cyclic-di-AMP receptor [Tissierellaceae bacterium]
MKLIIAIIQDQYINKVTRALMQKKIRATRLSSSGGFLNSGSTTLLIGTEEENIDSIVEIIEHNSKSSKVRSEGKDVPLGRATLFIMNIEDYLRV